MANIKKGARAYYADTDYRRDGMNEAYGKIDSMPSIPTPTAEDVGKVIKINDNGVYALSDDLHTPVIANPDTESTERLDKLTVGNTTYLVNEDVLPTVLKAVRLKINTIHGGDANVVMNGLAFKNSINGNIYSYGGSDTITSDIEGSPDLSGLLRQNETYFASSNLPCNIDITFADGLDTTQFNDFDLKCGYYENASPLSVEVFVSADGEHFISVATISNLTYTRNSYVVIYEFGAVDLKIPDYTSADRGKFLAIDNTDHIVWDNVPSELPTVTSADAGKVLTVDNAGAWELTSDIVSISYDATAGGPVLSKDIEEIINIINNGRMVDFVYDINHYILSQISRSEMIIVNSRVSIGSDYKRLYVAQIIFNRSTGVGSYSESYTTLS